MGKQYESNPSEFHQISSNAEISKATEPPVVKLPPPDVVEAARRLRSWHDDGDAEHEYAKQKNNESDDIETVCKWVLATNSTKQ